MAKKSKSTNKGVQYLDSQKLSDAAKKLDGSVKAYNKIIENVTSMTTILLFYWHGEGKTAFEKDYTKIYQQLTDVGDIMYELYDALIDADAAYIQTDEDIAKGFMVEKG